MAMSQPVVRRADAGRIPRHAAAACAPTRYVAAALHSSINYADRPVTEIKTKVSGPTWSARNADPVHYSGGPDHERDRTSAAWPDTQPFLNNTCAPRKPCVVDSASHPCRRPTALGG